LAAYITGVFVDNPRIFCTATDSDIVKSFHEQNISTMDSGSITGMNGLIIGIAKLRGIKGTCLLGETSGYVIDAKASKYILEALLSIFHINLDMSSLEKRAKDIEMLIRSIEQQMSGRSGKMLEGQQSDMTHKPGNLFLERHISRAIDRTHQRRLQNRSLTINRLSESSWYDSAVSTTLSNHYLLQL
jgi:uncharacterized protein